MCRRAGLFSTTSMYRPHLPGVYCQRRFNSSIKALRAAFLNPASPYYLAPGTAGPALPNDVALPEQSSETHAKGIIHSSSQKQLYPSELGELLEQGREKLAQSGFQRSSIWQQNIVWGDQDPFQHVNNVQYGTSCRSIANTYLPLPPLFSCIPTQFVSSNRSFINGYNPFTAPASFSGSCIHVAVLQSKSCHVKSLSSWVLK
ncbi:hypothetical protein D9757_006539 [Collybiopsis confluens]|uniref:Uncharacterized protein n=1 Tax=Collybiopsis confluens TaxID=2823264 RepID=A0A8H5MB71_9AGAR|nr:hypothetical protein D9757_006539 [Collybiopsis confluens]